MASRAKRVTAQDRTDINAKAVAARYQRWLTRQPLAQRTRDAYAAQVDGFVAWLAGSEHGGAALAEGHVRDWAVRDYKRFMKTKKRWSPASVNQALAAIDNFYRSLGMGRPDVRREALPQVAPQALDLEAQRKWLRAAMARELPQRRGGRLCSARAWLASCRRACSSGEPLRVSLGVPLIWAIEEDAAIVMAARTKRTSDLILPLLCMLIKYHAIVGARAM